MRGSGSFNNNERCKTGSLSDIILDKAFDAWTLDSIRKVHFHPLGLWSSFASIAHRLQL